MPTEKEELMSTKKEKRSTEHEKSTMPDIQKNNEQLDRCFLQVVFAESCKIFL